MAEPQQPDGAYPRVNATMINEGLFNNMIVSIVGRAVNFDGANLLQLESGDGGRVNINLSDAEFHYVPGQIIEVIGHLDGKNIQVSSKFFRQLAPCLYPYFCCDGNP